MNHVLKTLPVYWDAIERGEKLFECRRNDRAFQKGDTVELCRLDDEYNRWILPKKVLKFRIGFILQGGQFGIDEQYCVFQLEPL